MTEYSPEQLEERIDWLTDELIKAEKEGSHERSHKLLASLHRLHRDRIRRNVHDGK